MISVQIVVPHYLVILVRMISEGLTIKDQLAVLKNNFSLSIAVKLMKFV